ncbi:hypothetical protein ACLOJK_015703 [Asimina triloba]
MRSSLNYQASFFHVVEPIGSDKCCYKHCNLLDEAQVQETVAHTIEKYGHVDILFSNAGIMGRSIIIMEKDLQELDRIVAVNMRGSAAFIKHVARVMMDSQTRCSIICTASIASIVGGLSPHSYSISKHALGLVRSAAFELGKQGIRVNCISPSVVPHADVGGRRGRLGSTDGGVCAGQIQLEGNRVEAQKCG